MKIKVKDIPTSGANFEGCISARQLDVERDYWTLNKDVEVKAKGCRIGEYINLTICVESEKRILCSRCLEEKILPYQISFSHQMKISDELEEIDITELVRQEIILNIGIRELCRDDCQGICPRCGGNRNKGQCKCSGSESK